MSRDAQNGLGSPLAQDLIPQGQTSIPTYTDLVAGRAQISAEIAAQLLDALRDQSKASQTWQRLMHLTGVTLPNRPDDDLPALPNGKLHKELIGIETAIHELSDGARRATLQAFVNERLLPNLLAKAAVAQLLDAAIKQIVQKLMEEHDFVEMLKVAFLPLKGKKPTDADIIALLEKLIEQELIESKGEGITGTWKLSRHTEALSRALQFMNRASKKLALQKLADSLNAQNFIGITLFEDPVKTSNPISYNFKFAPLDPCEDAHLSNDDYLLEVSFAPCAEHQYKDRRYHKGQYTLNDLEDKLREPVGISGMAAHLERDAPFLQNWELVALSDTNPPFMRSSQSMGDKTLFFHDERQKDGTYKVRCFTQRRGDTNYHRLAVKFTFDEDKFQLKVAKEALEKKDLAAMKKYKDSIASKGKDIDEYTKISFINFITNHLIYRLQSETDEKYALELFDFLESCSEIISSFGEKMIGYWRSLTSSDLKKIQNKAKYQVRKIKRSQ